MRLTKSQQRLVSRITTARVLTETILKEGYQLSMIKRMQRISALSHCAVINYCGPAQCILTDECHKQFRSLILKSKENKNEQ